ncbi:MAG TPA: aspartate aminotransferase family protein, partial [Archangium sp.]
MDLPELGTSLLNRVPSRLLSVAERYLKNVPMLRERLAKETDAMLAELEGDLKPYRGQHPTFDTLPPQGLSH